MISMQDLKLAGKRVLIREDLNVPMKNGEITDDTRIRASLPTIQLAIEKQANVILTSHLGRPEEGKYDSAYSLQPVARRLSELLDRPVRLIKDWLSGFEMQDGEVVICENVRFNAGEKKNNEDLSRAMAALCDVYVNDAFATAHRAQASTHGIAKYAPLACAGPLLNAEINALRKALEQPAKPMLAIVGGSKVSTKLEVLETLSSKVDQLIVGGGIANTFMKAVGLNIGHSLCEDALVDKARDLIEQAKANNAEIPIPVDVVCAKEFAETAQATVKRVEDVADDDLILDVGPETAAHFVELAKKAGTIVWNGPLGVFEFDQFGNGTKTLAHGIADSQAFSIAGGGDTLAAIAKYQVTGNISYISTGGGAFLEFLEGRVLPAVDILEERARSNPEYSHPSEGY